MYMHIYTHIYRETDRQTDRDRQRRSLCNSYRRRLFELS